MIISKDVINAGIDEELIILMHSKSRLRDYLIEKVALVRKTNDDVCLRLSLVESDIDLTNRSTYGGTRRIKTRQMSLDINKSILRDRKLNFLLNDERDQSR